MAKAKVVFVCCACGAASPKWQGKCPGCGAWESLVEEVRRDPDAARGARAPRTGGTSGTAGATGASRPVAIADIRLDASPRLATGIPELDRLLGGGLVPGAALLVGGEPGIGKSTLLLQVAHWLGLAGEQADPPRPPVLYVTAEESAAQLRMRAERLQTLSPRLLVLAENDLDAILAAAESVPLGGLVVDSVQMTYWAELGSAPGSVAQVRECAGALVALAKRRQIPLFLVGHVTKDGSIAGPKVLEHMVDVVLAFEGDRFHAARILRASKNRFGAINEIGVFEMAADGMRPVLDPSRLFLSGRRTDAPGTVVSAPLSGTRPVLAEIQALAAPALPGSAKRRVAGADANRVAMVLAVLEKRGGMVLCDQDVFVNVVAGAEAKEPGTDLAVLLAVAGSVRDRALPPDCIAIGEVGLGGEIRPVSQLEARLAEAARLGFRRALVPAGGRSRGMALELVGVGTVDEALAHLE